MTKTTAGGAGVNLVASSVTFESLGITTSNGPGLSAVTSGTVTVTNNSKAISATGGAIAAAPAIIANAVTLNANFSGVDFDQQRQHHERQGRLAHDRLGHVELRHRLHHGRVGCLLLRHWR